MIGDKPLKRNENIQPLSRDHHFGLLFCWKIRIGLNARMETGRMISYLDYFWKGHLKEHFSEEEKLLFNKADHSICDQANSEHVELTEIINSVLDGRAVNAREALENIVGQLKAHIRFEERLLFPFLERHLSEIQLIEIGQQLDLERKVQFEDNYGDEFWIK